MSDGFTGLDRERFGSIDAKLEFMVDEIKEQRKEDAKLHERINEVTAEQTRVNSAIHGRISNLKFWFTGAATVSGGISGFIAGLFKS